MPAAPRSATISAVTDTAHLALLFSAELLVPTPDAPVTPGTCEVVAPEQLIVTMHEDELGLAFPAFTTPEAFLRWRPEGGACALRPGRAVAELAAIDEGGRLIVDPGSPDAVAVPTEALRAALQWEAAGVELEAMGGGGQVLVAASSDALVSEVAAAVAHVVRARAFVVAAHLVVIDDGSGAPGRCVALRLADGTDPADVMPELVEAVADAAPEAAGLNFTVVAGQLADSVAATGMDLLA